MRKLGFTGSFVVLACATCFAQTSFQGLTPGESRIADADKVLGKRLVDGQARQVWYSPPAGLKTVVVEYGDGLATDTPDDIIDHIVVWLLKPVSLGALIQKFKLPEKPDFPNPFNKCFGGAALVCLHYSGRGDDERPLEATGVNHIEYFSRRLAATQDRLFRLPSEQSSIRVNRSEPASGFELQYDRAFNGTTLTFYAKPRVEDCQADCANNPRCKGFTWIKAGTYNPNDAAMCYLIAPVTSSSPARGHISGLKK